MRFRKAYTLSFLQDLRDQIEFPIILELEGKTIEIQAPEGDGKTASASVEGPVDVDELSLRTGEAPLHGGEPSKGIVVAEKSDFDRCFSRAVHTLSFVTDVAIQQSSPLWKDKLIPETARDEARLRTLGTDQLDVAVCAVVSTRSFQASKLTLEALEFLASKETGIAIYSSAILASDPVAQFRELWRVLESSFRSSDKKLIRLISKFPPSIELRFTLDELDEFLNLRGRASHAQSRAGIDEYHHVIGEVTSCLPRLKCLVEQTLLTKKTWGSPTLGTQRLAPLSAFVRADGGIVLIQPKRSNDRDA